MDSEKSYLYYTSGSCIPLGPFRWRHLMYESVAVSGSSTTSNSSLLLSAILDLPLYSHYLHVYCLVLVVVSSEYIIKMDSEVSASLVRWPTKDCDRLFERRTLPSFTAKATQKPPYARPTRAETSRVVFFLYKYMDESKAKHSRYPSM